MASTDMNRFIGVGRLVSDPQTAATQNGNEYAKFTIASNRVYVSGDQKREEVSFLDCVAWGKLAGVIGEYVRKGSQIVIEGRLKQERWEKDGQKRSKIVVVVESLQFLQKKGEEAGGQNPRVYSDEDVPF